MIALYHKIKTPISFWCRLILNLISLIQLSNTLPVELTGTHNITITQLSFMEPTITQYHIEN